MFFTEMKKFFDQNFSFYIRSKYSNVKMTIFGAKAYFFVLFFSLVRRYPKTAFRSFKKIFQCNLMLPKYSELFIIGFF